MTENDWKSRSRLRWLKPYAQGERGSDSTQLVAVTGRNETFLGVHCSKSGLLQ